VAFTLTFNVRDMVTGLDELSTTAVRVGVRRALTRTLASAKVAMSRAVASDAGLKVGYVKDQMSVRVVETAASQGDFVGQLSISGKRIPLIEFSAKGPEPSNGKGRVSARVGGVRKVYRGAFITTMPTGHRGVFARKGSKRLPIVELKGPSLPHVFVKHGAVGIERAQEQFVKELQHEVDFALHQIAASKGPRVNIGPGGATIG
jgi:hypothetical protein